MTITRTGERPQQRDKVTRRRWLLAGVVLVLVAAGWLTANNRGDDDVSVVTPASATTPTVTESHKVSTSPRPGRDVSWRIFAGVDLPISATAGPACLTETVVSCFAHTGNGAAVAAAHLLVRTFPFAGSDTFEPTIAKQVTGPGTPALARLTKQAYDQAAPAAGVEPGKPIRDSEGWIAGYRLDPDDDPLNETATVDVLIVASGEYTGFTSYRVHLRWLDGDWRLVAPDWGDWRSSARAVRNPYPASYLDYDNLGLGTGGAS